MHLYFALPGFGRHLFSLMTPSTIDTVHYAEKGKWCSHVMGFVFLLSLWFVTVQGWYVQPCYEQGYRWSNLLLSQWPRYNQSIRHGDGEAVCVIVSLIVTDVRRPHMGWPWQGCFLYLHCQSRRILRQSTVRHGLEKVTFISIRV